MKKATIETTLGTISLELNDEKAPLTVANFEEYAKSGHYDGTIFHRVIGGFMIQGGGFTRDMNQKPTRAPIRNEAMNGLGNKRGTIAMARTSVVDSATSQFFINHVDNDFLDFTSPTPRGFGYAVFGRVTDGMDVVDAIAKVRTGNNCGYENKCDGGGGNCRCQHALQLHLLPDRTAAIGYTHWFLRIFNPLHCFTSLFPKSGVIHISFSIISHILKSQHTLWKNFYGNVRFFVKNSHIRYVFYQKTTQSCVFRTGLPHFAFLRRIKNRRSKTASPALLFTCHPQVIHMLSTSWNHARTACASFSFSRMEMLCGQ